MRRSLRLASGLVLFTYITAHLINHALGLVSLKTAEAALEFAVEVWSSPLGTVLLYGAFAIHFVLALWSVYERRTFRLPPLELLRIALGFTLPIMLIGHAGWRGSCSGCRRTTRGWWPRSGSRTRRACSSA